MITYLPYIICLLDRHTYDGRMYFDAVEAENLSFVFHVLCSLVSFSYTDLYLTFSTAFPFVSPFFPFIPSFLPLCSFFLQSFRPSHFSLFLLSQLSPIAVTHCLLRGQFLAWRSDRSPPTYSYSVLYSIVLSNIQTRVMSDGWLAGGMV